MGIPLKNYNFTTANELHVPLSTDQAPMITSLNLLSADVDHSFWVPALFGKIDSIPNQVNHMWFNPDKAGMYVGQCAQFCGVEHAKMLLRVYVQTPEDFAAWVKISNNRRFRIRRLPKAGSCSSRKPALVAMWYAGPLPRENSGLTLHLMSRDTLASGASANTVADLKLWIKDPDYVKPGSLIPAMQLSDEQIDKVVAYLTTLK